MYWKTIKTLFFVSFFVLFSQNIKAQVSVQTFIDPCTKEVTLFTVPLQGGTTIFFLNKSQYFTAADVASGVFSSWVNQTYSEYRQTNPCSQQQGQVTQNQITSQIISSTVQSVVGSIMSSAQSSSSGGNLNAGGNNKKDGNKQSNGNSNGSGNNNNGSGSSSQGGENGGQSQGSGGTTGSTGGTNSSQGGSTGTQGGNSTGSSNPPQGGSGSSQPPVGGSGTTGGSTTGGSGTTGGSTTGGSGTTGGSTTGGSGTGGNGSSTGSSGGTTGGSTTGGGTGSGNNSNSQSNEEVGATTTMNNDAHNDNGSGGSSSSGGGKSGGGKSGGKSGSSNPLIISSDLTTAQNLNKSFTAIINLSTNKSSMTGLSSFGATAMIWTNFNQFALSTKYTKLHYNKKNTIKYIHNASLTGVYTYGNILGFLGYSGILNAGKWGVTGFNVSGAVSIISEDKSGYYSPSVTAFYTRPFKVGKKLMVSPELYVMSTPLVYSTKEQVTITDRFFSGFLGSGFDYQISKRFKINMNYKANISSNPEIPILSFFLIGSKVNL
jgi:hypothetical protein